MGQTVLLPAVLGSGEKMAQTGTMAGGKDQEHLANVRRMQCIAHTLGPCLGSTQAHHHTAHRGKGQKADDSQAIPLCLGHHHDFHAATGPFKGWDKQRRRDWQDIAVQATQRDVGKVFPDWF
jgi:hypothetical protein